jgi:hypothetical protein
MHVNGTVAASDTLFIYKESIKLEVASITRYAASCKFPQKQSGSVLIFFQPCNNVWELYIYVCVMMSTSIYINPLTCVCSPSVAWDVLCYLVFSWGGEKGTCDSQSSNLKKINITSKLIRWLMFLHNLFCQLLLKSN